MLRPGEKASDDLIVETWLRRIEQRMILRPAERFLVEEELPAEESLLDLLDNQLKRDGWRLERPVHSFTGELCSPRQRRYINTQRREMFWFIIVPDTSCSTHRFVRPFGSKHSFCPKCGAIPGASDHVREG